MNDTEDMIHLPEDALPFEILWMSQLEKYYQDKERERHGQHYPSGN